MNNYGAGNGRNLGNELCNGFDRLSDGFNSCQICSSDSSRVMYDSVGWLIVMQWVGGSSIGDGCGEHGESDNNISAVDEWTAAMVLVVATAFTVTIMAMQWC